jgi:uncharacterized protein DUF5650/chitobiase/beta-hexosaminidase-like protein
MNPWKRIASLVSLTAAFLILLVGGTGGCGKKAQPGQVSTPTFSPDPGTYISSLQVILSTETDGASLFYTTDGTAPTPSSTAYTGPFMISQTTTVNAIAVKEGLTDSEVATATYTINPIANPSADASSRFGAEVRTLASGNLVVTDPSLTVGGHTLAGSTYLYNGKTGELISTLSGTADNEAVGQGGIGVLTNGNFVVVSNFGAADGSHPGHGITFVNGATGLNDSPSLANTLAEVPLVVGADNVAVPCLTGQPALPRQTCRTILSNIINGLTIPTTPLSASGSPFSLGLPPISNETFFFMPLPNDNYLAQSVGSGVGGAFTFGSATTGVSGEVSTANGLLGRDGDMLGIGIGGILTPCGQVGENAVVRFPFDGDYLVNPNTACGGPTPYTTIGSGETGALGTIPIASSFDTAVTRLTNGNYTLASSTDVTLIDGNSFSTISTLNTGSASTVFPLSNGNYVVTTPGFNGNVGAATFVNGDSGLSDPIADSNSLVGAAAGDMVGSGGVKELSNGNYVVVSPAFGGGNGAVTLGNGTTGTFGTVGSDNSLVGSAATEGIGSGGVTPLVNGNFVVRSPGFASGKGAITLGNGITPSTGPVTLANSLVGSAPADNLGSGGGLLKGITPLKNGNFVVYSPNFGGGVGAITFGDGVAGVIGPVGVVNSLVGSDPTDQLGSGGVIPLTGGAYVVVSAHWNHDTGAVTFGNGTVGVAGGITAANSLVGTVSGSIAGDKVGGGVFHDEVISNWKDTPLLANPTLPPTYPANTGDGGHITQTDLQGVVPLTGGGYVVMSPDFGGGVGAATFGGTNGVVGEISADNSLIGSKGGDHVSGGGVVALPNGNYVVLSPLWSNGSAFAAGAATFGEGTSGITGVVSADNSLVGASAGDFVGFTGRNILSGLKNPTPTVTSAQIYQTLFAQNGGSDDSLTDLEQFGISASNSYFPAQVTVLSTGDYVIPSPFFGNELGAATVGSGETGVSGVVSADNSLIGSVPRGYLGVSVQEDVVNAQAIVSGSPEMAGAAVEILAQRLP